MATSFIVPVGVNVVIQGSETAAQWYTTTKAFTVAPERTQGTCPIRNRTFLAQRLGTWTVWFSRNQIQQVTTPDAPVAAPSPRPAVPVAPTRPAISNTNFHVGEIGDRVTMTFRVVRIGDVVTTEFGSRRIVSGTDEAGRVVQFWSDVPVEHRVGEVLNLRGTVRTHGEFRGVRQTTLNRVVVVETVVPGATSATVAPAAPARRQVTGVNAEGVQVEEQFGIDRGTVERIQAEADRRFDEQHRPVIDQDAIASLSPYILTYDIPSYSNFSPVARLRPIGYHLQGSVWVVNEGDLPWSLIHFLRELGADVQYYQFSSTEGARLVRTAVRTLIREVAEARRDAEALVASNTARMVRNATETGMSDDEILARQENSMRSAQRRLATLESDLNSTCRRFGIDPTSLQVTSLRGVSESIRSSMVERSEAFVNALRRLRAIGTVTADALAREMDARPQTAAIGAAADYLSESDDGDNAEAADDLREAFLPPVDADADGTFSLDDDSGY